MMDLDRFVSKYSLEDIIKIEQEKDLQFIALQKAWEKIQNIDLPKETLIAKFLYMILQNALVSYQLSGKGENRRNEFAESLINYIENDLDNLDWRKSMLSNCKNNCRLNDAKFSRIKKISVFEKEFLDYKKLKEFYSDMESLDIKLSQVMNQSKTAKTVVFAVKMFGYGARIVFGKLIEYPFDINIPIDSRLEKIYKKNTGKDKFTKSEIGKYFEDISKKYKISPLHLDSLLWVEYWEKIN